MSATTTMTADLESGIWPELPSDVMAAIFSKVSTIGVLASVQLVCKSWFRICQDPAVWRNIDMPDFAEFWFMDFDLKKLCCNAVDRSAGQLLSINIQHFGSDDLLDYIAPRSRNLRSLRLVDCGFSNEGLSAAVANFSLLEELDLFNCSFSQEALVAVGKLCPLLKSLKLNNQCVTSPELAIAIAENMPELRHLVLFGNKLTNDGLLAILDGCPRLESLDLRQCSNLNLAGDLEKRCSEQIKVLRRPNDPTDDFEFRVDIYRGWSSAEDYPSGISDIEFAPNEEDYIYDFCNY